ncbi:MAG: M20/M25/M40 family metallo-hydrolase [Mucilaginibacter sp.]|uniref:M20/M25/M40 family metallo-hydrolase n=1 Tax=Mucilaginibacter sp. L3T2-6 TaxID=3062491 RepID=UPI002676B199|nr:M20/M25/M40 family metallo-hydrolase [Mucilaginibacter sp. L3T2-6]MDO3641864.1 M20/M25/M40 family metallo-hydrolase [Mucilaginibacter sp. L3T2-6]MDV6214458.1 M20/M25/M40 family metallo-hydrolase [Mucilaginibacter sp. L3T2-6]
MKKSIIAAALMAITSYSFGQDVNKLIKQDQVEKVIKTLSADDMQGRATFTPGIEKAAKYIESQYKEAGLVPLKGNKDFRQNFTMMRNTSLKALASINGKVISQDSVLAMSNAASFNWSNNSDVQVVKLDAGKNFRTEYMSYIKNGKKMLILVDPQFTNMFKAIKGRVAHGMTSFKKAEEQELVFVLGHFDDVKSFEVSYTGKSEELPLFNIAGMIPGKSKPDEYVVFSGHYDHLGIIKPVKGDSIANGADDDASGTTAVITLAKYYKKLNNNARTLIFVAFTAEEIGEFGSQYFATTVDPDKVVAMFNIEMIGKASKFGENSAFITGFERSDFGTILQKNLEGTAFKFYPDPYPQQNLFYRSDNASLAAVGVPAHTISTDQIDIDKLYHTVGDEFSSLDVANITSTIRAIALSSRTIVSGQDTPKRVPKLER